MPFVQRENGAIIGLFAMPQPGYAEEELPDDNTEVAAFLNPPPGPYTLPKMLLWTRLSPQEAEAVDAAMAGEPAQLRGIWNSATEVQSDSEFFGTLEIFLAAVLGEDRAVELLQPE